LEKLKMFNLMCLTMNVRNFIESKGGCMKKLLVLALVLGMASMAQAVLCTGTLTSTHLPGTVTASLQITSNPNEDLYFAIAIKGPGGVPATFAIGANAPTDSYDADSMFNDGVDTATYGNGEMLSAMSYTSTYPLGTWINATFTGAVFGDTIVAYETRDGMDFGTGVVGQQGANGVLLGSVLITPEPITMGLLGLGGLFLRRRSK
jgi:hypothetical protein